MELEINVVTVGILLIIAGFLFVLGIFVFSWLRRKLGKKSYTEKRGG